MGQGDNGRGGARAAVAQRPVDRLDGRLVNVTVGNKEQQILVGKLSIDQWLGIAGLALEWSATMPSEAKERFARVRAGEASVDEVGTFQSIRSMLNPDTILGLYGILVEKKPDQLRPGFDIVQFADVLDAADEYNDLRKVWAPFSRVIGRWRTSPESSSQPS